MELTLDRDALVSATKTAEVLARAAGPVELLKNLCFSVQADKTVRIKGSNLAAYLEVTAGTHDTEEREFLLDARKFSSLVGGLRANEVHLHIKPRQKTLHVKAGKGEYSILTSTAEQYPNDRVDYTPMGVLPSGALFRSMVQDVAYAADNDGQSPDLGAIYFRVEDQDLILMATDRRRCARAQCYIDEASDTPLSTFLVPHGISRIIATTINTDAPLILGSAGDKLVLDNGQVWLSCRVLEHPWHYDMLNTHLMDMSDCDTVTVDRTELAEALDRAAIFADSELPVADLIFSGNEIEVRTDDTALTGATSDLVRATSCPPITKKVRIGVVRDALTHANSDTVDITLSSERRAVKFEHHPDDTERDYENCCVMVPQIISNAGAVDG